MTAEKPTDPGTQRKRSTSGRGKVPDPAASDPRKPFLEAGYDHGRVLEASHQEACRQAEEDRRKYATVCEEAQETARKSAEAAYEAHQERLQALSGEDAQRLAFESERDLAEQLHEVESSLRKRMQELDRDHHELVRSRIHEIREREGQAWNRYLAAVKNAWTKADVEALDVHSVAVIADTLLRVASVEAASSQTASPAS